MIKVTVELWPFGSEERKEVIAEAFIANDGSGNQTNGNYECWVKQKTNRSLKFGRVKNYKRWSNPVWKLVELCIQSAFRGDEKPDTRLSEGLKRRASNATKDI